MGAWGENSFENDEALDWLCVHIEESSDAVKLIRETLEAATKAEYLDQTDCEDAIAAAELIACGRGARPKNVEVPKEVDDWLQRNAYAPDDLMTHLAIAAMNRALDEDIDRSELAHPDKWAGEDVQEKWFAAVRDLRDRLKSTI